MKYFIWITSFIFFSYFKGLNCLYWPCTSDSDCTIVEKATCSYNGNCQCPVGYLFSADVTRCLQESLYGEPCEEATQCSHMLTGALCSTGICTCQDGLTYIRGRCRTLVPLHSECNEDIDCFFSYDREAVICKDRTCQCADGFYERSENICRRISMNVGDACVVQADCQGENLICEILQSKCVEKSNRVDSDSKEIGIQTINSEFLLPNTRSISIDATLKDEQRVAFGDDCENNNEPCPSLSHSICRENRCHCLLGYYPKNGLCMAELGEVADSAELCNGADFRNNKCVCAHNQFYMPDMRSCIKHTTLLGSSCTQQSQCSPFGAALCPSASPKRCECRSYATYNTATELCISKVGMGQYCQTNLDCSLKNSQCDTDKNSCTCQDYYFEIDEQCKPGYNANCEVDEDCVIENSECYNDTSVAVKDDETLRVENSVCKCKSDFIYHENSCLRQATSYGDSCTENEQCKPLLGDLSKCIEEKCECPEDKQYKNGKCNEKKALGEACTKSSECFVTENANRVECRNAMCQCEFDYTPDTEVKKCVKSGKSSSGRPSPLKVITILLTTAAFLVTSAAIKEAYY